MSLAQPHAQLEAVVRQAVAPAKGQFGAGQEHDRALEQLAEANQRLEVDNARLRNLLALEQASDVFELEHEIERAAIYCTQNGNSWFGTWLMEDCVTYALARNEGVPVTTAPSTTSGAGDMPRRQTPAGRRYLESPGNDWRFQLFVRAAKGTPYRACGPVTLERAEGAKPMSIHWRLSVPLPSRLFREFSILRGQ